MHGAAFWGIAVATLLAGCSTAGGADGGAAPAAGHAGPSAGTLRGVVVDEAIRPLEGASVALVGVPGLAIVTGADGQFQVTGLEPRTYAATIVKPGYYDAAQEFVVTPDPEPRLVRVVMVRNPDTEPYVVADEFKGFVVCSFGTYGAGNTNLCGLSEFVVELMCYGADPVPPTYCIEDPTSSRVIYNQDMDSTPTFLHNEMVWEANTQFSEWATYYRYWRPAGDDTLTVIDITNGMSPLVATSTQDDVENWYADAEGPIAMRYVHVAGASQDNLAAVQVNQPYEFFTFFFHNWAPPEGWVFSIDGPIEPPP